MDKLREIWYGIKDKWYELRDQWEEKDSRDRGKIIAIASSIVALIIISIVAIFSFNKTKISAVTREEQTQMIDSVNEQVQTVSQIVADNNETMNEDLEAINDYLNALDAMISEYQQELEEVTAILKDETADENDTKQEDAEAVGGDLDSLSSQVTEVRSEISALKGIIEKGNTDMQTVLKNSNKDNTEVLKAMTTMQTTITNDTNTRFEKINTLVGNLDTKLKNTQSDLTKLINSLSADVDSNHKETIATLTKMQESLEKGDAGNIASLQKSIDSIEANYKTYMTDLSNSVTTQIESLSSDMDEGFDGVASDISALYNKLIDKSGAFMIRFDSIDNAIKSLQSDYSNNTSEIEEISSKLDSLIESGSADVAGKNSIIDKIKELGGEVVDEDGDGNISYEEIKNAINSLYEKGYEDGYEKGYEDGYAAGEKVVSTTVKCHAHTQSGSAELVEMPISDYAAWKAGLDNTTETDTEGGCFTKRKIIDIDCDNSTLKKAKVKDNVVWYQCDHCSYIYDVTSDTPDAEPETIDVPHIVGTDVIYEIGCGYAQGQIVDVKTTVSPAAEN